MKKFKLILGVLALILIGGLGVGAQNSWAFSDSAGCLDAAGDYKDLHSVREACGADPDEKRVLLELERQ